MGKEKPVPPLHRVLPHSLIWYNAMIQSSVMWSWGSWAECHGPTVYGCCSEWLSWIVPITIKNTPWVPHLSLLHIPQSSLQCTVEGWNSLTLCHTRGTAWHCETAQGAKLWHQCLRWGELPVCVCILHKTRFLTYQSYLQSGQTAVDLALQGGSDAMVAALLDWDIVTSSSNCMHVHCAQCNC